MIEQVESFEELEQLLKPQLWAMFNQVMLTDYQQEFVLGVASIAFIAGMTKGTANAAALVNETMKKHLSNQG